MARADSQPQSVLELLAGDECEFCVDGELERDTYRGNRAVVCDGCGVPQVQVWGPLSK